MERIRESIREEFNIEAVLVDPKLHIVWTKKGRGWQKRTESFNLESLSGDALASFIENKLKDGWSLYSKNRKIRELIMSSDTQSLKKIKGRVS